MQIYGNLVGSFLAHLVSWEHLSLESLACLKLLSSVIQISDSLEINKILKNKCNEGLKGLWGLIKCFPNTSVQQLKFITSPIIQQTIKDRLSSLTIQVQYWYLNGHI